MSHSQLDSIHREITDLSLARINTKYMSNLSNLLVVQDKLSNICGEDQHGKVNNSGIPCSEEI
jgi:hypothetical protein